MPNPFVHYFDDTRQLYSGNPKDMVPFLSIRAYEGKIIFQIPAGGMIEVSPEVAKIFGQEIIDLAKSELTDSAEA